LPAFKVVRHVGVVVAGMAFSPGVITAAVVEASAV
jgi:hypothetical protein